MAFGNDEMLALDTCGSCHYICVMTATGSCHCICVMTVTRSPTQTCGDTFKYAADVVMVPAVTLYWTLPLCDCYCQSRASHAGYASAVYFSVVYHQILVMCLTLCKTPVQTSVSRSAVCAHLGCWHASLLPTWCGSQQSKCACTGG